MACWKGRDKKKDRVELGEEDNSVGIEEEDEKTPSMLTNTNTHFTSERSRHYVIFLLFSHENSII